MPKDARFCPQCAHPTSEATPAAASPRSAPTRSIASYTPKHLADRILQSRSALEGERKQVTVLFADVQGSMELAAQLGAEAWHAVLDRFFAILADGIHRFEGTVNQFTGDGIMALFGAPLAHEDHAQRACYAALHLQAEIARYATELKREHGLGFSTRIGVNSGEVVVGKIGDDLRMDYTAQGETVGLAQRMEALASPDACYVTPATARLVSGYFAFEDLGEFRVKGVAEPVRVQRLAGLGAARTRFDISRARGLSRFVGRTSDIRTLDDALEQTAAGNGQVVGVVAEAGTGKSRLCFEFLERCRARGMRVFEGRAVAHGKNIPFLPVLEVFRAYFGIVSTDDDRSAREKIAGRMVLLDTKFADALPLLFDFLGVADPQRPAPRLDPEARQRQLLAVMRQVIQSVSEAQPTITLIEDLHWLDAASAEFLEHMVEAREGSRNLLLLNFRPEYRAEWMAKSWYRQIPLTPLGREAIAELLKSLLGDDASLAGLAADVHTRTGGNPFFTEEVAQALIESGQLVGERGAYKLVAPIERLTVPATVQAVLAARIDRLPEREKRVLQTASVIGKDFAEPLLAAVAELPAGELKSALAALRRAEFVHEAAIYPVTEYAFKHPLTHEVALGSQLRERRRAVHAAVARAIEQQDAEHLDERAALLAHHSEEAGEALTAARWHRRAAEWVATTDFGAAAHHWGRVRALLRELPRQLEAAELGVAACTQLLGASWRLGLDPEEARALLAEGVSHAEVVGDTRAPVIFGILHARSRCSEGDIHAYVESMRAMVQSAERLGDKSLQANAAGVLADAYGFAARYPQLTDLADDALARFGRGIPRADWFLRFDPHALTSMWRGNALAWTGRVEEGLRQLEHAARSAREDGTQELAFYCQHHENIILRQVGGSERALTNARQLCEVAVSLGDRVVLTGLASMAWCDAHMLEGRPAEAITAARAALEVFNRVERFHAGWCLTMLAAAQLDSGDLHAALDAADAAIAACRRSLRANFEAIAHGVRARALLRRDGAAARDAAEAALAAAAALIEQSGARVLSPHLSQWRAELVGALGDAGARAQLLREAEQGFAAIGAPRQVERIRTVLAT